MRTADDIGGTAPLELDLPLVRSGYVLATDLGDREAVMLDIERGTYFGVEGVARLIWDTLKEPVTPREVIAVVRTRFPNVAAEECERDALEFLEDLVRNRLAQRHGPLERG